MNDLIKQMPPLLNATEIYHNLLITPEIDASVKTESERLISLEKLYNFYIPNQMTAEIYNKIYLSIRRSLLKKTDILSIKQRNINYSKIQLNSTTGVIGGGDCFSIIGAAGIGKTASIYHSVTLATGNVIYEISNPYLRVIPVLTIQTPFDCSVKALLLEIIRQIDNILHTNYYPRTIPTIDVLIGSVCQLCLNHVALLILDEIQNVVSHKAGISLVHCLTEIINNSSVAICFVGTPECETFFSSTDYLARRTTGLNYSAMNYDSYFKECCDLLWNYQPLLYKTTPSESDYQWLYIHSAGIIANLITLIHDSQELAIIMGTEKIDKNIMNQVYCNRMIHLHPHINTPKSINQSVVTTNISQKSQRQRPKTQISKENTISQNITIAKENHIDIIELLKQHFSVVEVSI